jgi:ABC-type sugar transport system substrate-binding protein
VAQAALPLRPNRKRRSGVMRNRVTAIGIAVLLTVAVAATGSMAASSESASPAQKKWVVGVSWPTLKFPFAVALKRASDTRAKKLGVRTFQADANLDTTQELNNVQTLLGKGIDCLLFVGVQADASVASIKAANKAGVPVVQFNGLANGGKYVTFVGSEHIQSGILLGKWTVALQKRMAKAGSPNIKVLYMHGVAGQIQDLARAKGFKQTIKKAGISQRVKIIEQYADFDRGKAQTVAESVLAANPDLTAIAANNDDMALGAYAAVKAAGKSGKVRIAGIDGLPETLAGVKAGRIDATVFQNPEAQGAGGMQACVDHLNGKKLPKKILIPFVLVTKKNVDAILKIANRVYPKG